MPESSSKAVAGSRKSTPSQERCARRNSCVLLIRSLCHDLEAYVAALLLVGEEGVSVGSDGKRTRLGRGRVLCYAGLAGRCGMRWYWTEASNA